MVALNLIIGKGVDRIIFQFMPLVVDFRSLVVVVEVGTVVSFDIVVDIVVGFVWLTALALSPSFSLFGVSFLGSR